MEEHSNTCEWDGENGERLETCGIVEKLLDFLTNDVTYTHRVNIYTWIDSRLLCNTLGSEHQPFIQTHSSDRICFRIVVREVESVFFLFSHFREYHYDFMDKMVLEGDEMTFSTIQVMFAFIWEHESNVPHTHRSPQIRINFLTALFSLPHDAQAQNSSINFRKPNNCLKTMCKYRFRANTQ